ncbi:unnamed protein product [Owenia fusiformis]|uniref:Uncharacterized protein n=1 Tax=Owenia fusiformis TaxID=6347 RepID=A0A8S4PTX9_OWEFU|nr:unnamed protein product [Owenia fusiformis]
MGLQVLNLGILSIALIITVAECVQFYDAHIEFTDEAGNLLHDNVHAFHEQHKRDLESGSLNQKVPVFLTIRSASETHKMALRRRSAGQSTKVIYTADNDTESVQFTLDTEAYCVVLEGSSISATDKGTATGTVSMSTCGGKTIAIIKFTDGTARAIEPSSVTGEPSINKRGLDNSYHVIYQIDIAKHEKLVVRPKRDADKDKVLQDSQDQLVTSKEAKTCKVSRKGKEYSGTLSETADGYTCQRWDSKETWSHDIGSSHNNDFPNNETLSEASNYCRNPDGESGGPWCYTTSKERRWSYCAVPTCADDFAGLRNMREDACLKEGGHYFEEHCYWIKSSETYGSHVAAEDACEDLGARLVSIDSQNETIFIEQLLKNKGTPSDEWMTSGTEIGQDIPRRWGWDLGAWNKPARLGAMAGDMSDTSKRCLSLIISNGQLMFNAVPCNDSSNTFKLLCEAGAESMEDRPVNFETAVFLASRSTEVIRAKYNNDLSLMTSYILVLYNSIGARWRDPKMVHPAKVTVTRVEFFQTTPPEFLRDVTDRYNYTWQCMDFGTSRWMRKHPDRKTWDIGAFHDTVICGALGWAWSGGLCGLGASSYICVLKGFFEHYQEVRHEFGHLLRFGHNSGYKDKDCHDDRGLNALLSRCQAKEFEQKMRGLGPGACVYDDVYEYYQEPLMLDDTDMEGQRWDMDKQCELHLGKGWSFFQDEGDRKFVYGTRKNICSSRTQHCINLSTYEIKKVENMLTLQGTWCGGKKWCRGGVGCIAWDKDPSHIASNLGHPMVVPGSWGSWGPWSGCSHTCGGGIMKRLRKCDSPKPKNTKCDGDYFEAKLCQTADCQNGPTTVDELEQHVVDIGTKICNKYPTDLKGNTIFAEYLWAGFGGKRTKFNDGHREGGCLPGVNGLAYTGNKSRTWGNEECARWDSFDNWKNQDWRFPYDANVSAAENHCRNPLGRGSLWGLARCLNKKEKLIPCWIPQCGGDELCDVNCNTNYRRRWRAALFPDGTPCGFNKEKGIKSVCVEGLCRKLTVI